MFSLHYMLFYRTQASWAALVVKDPSASSGDMRHGFHPWVRKILGEEHGYPFQYSCLMNPTDRGAWWTPLGSPRGHKESGMTEVT